MGDIYESGQRTVQICFTKVHNVLWEFVVFHQSFHYERVGCCHTSCLDVSLKPVSMCYTGVLTLAPITSVHYLLSSNFLSFIGVHVMQSIAYWGQHWVESVTFRVRNRRGQSLSFELDTCFNATLYVQPSCDQTVWHKESRH